MQLAVCSSCLWFALKSGLMKSLRLLNWHDSSAFVVYGVFLLASEFSMMFCSWFKWPTVGDIGEDDFYGVIVYICQYFYWFIIVELMLPSVHFANFLLADVPCRLLHFLFTCWCSLPQSKHSWDNCIIICIDSEKPKTFWRVHDLDQIVLYGLEPPLFLYLH